MTSATPVTYSNPIWDNTRWDGFALRPDDIVISTPAKCGTTWMQMICALLIFQTSDLPAPLTALSPWLDMRGRPIEEVRRDLEDQRHRRFIKTHTPLDGLPTADGVTFLVVGRDPRDVAVSMDDHMANMNVEVVESLMAASADPALAGQPVESVIPVPPADPRERLMQWILADGPTPAMDDTVAHLAGAWARRHDPDVVLLHYADLTRDLAGQMRRLADRLGVGVPEERWPGLVEAATFGRMRDRSADLVPDERLGLFTDHRAFFRSGTSGRWRDVLTPADLECYQARLAALAPDPELRTWLHHGTAA